MGVKQFASRLQRGVQLPPLPIRQRARATMASKRCQHRVPQRPRRAGCPGVTYESTLVGFQQSTGLLQ